MGAREQQKAWSEPTSINNGEFRIMMGRYQIQNACTLKCRGETLYCTIKKMWSVSQRFSTK